MINNINININRKRKTYIKPFNNEINVKLIFHKIQSVITSGFKCNLHSSDKIYEIELKSIKNEDKQFITTKDTHKE